MKLLGCVMISLLSIPTVLSAEGMRSSKAHEHGAGTLNVAIENGQVAMELTAPGADIVGFEHAAHDDEERLKVEAAVSDLARPLDLFVLASDAGCSVTAASVKILGEKDEHEEDHHAHDEHEEHAEGHDDHDESGEVHSEFFAEYRLDCADVTAIETIEFAYFERFQNALELDVQLVTESGAQALEVERDQPVLDLRKLF